MSESQTVQIGTIHYDPAQRPRMSQSIGKLAMALAKAQGEIENAEKDTKGNYGKYATLASTWNSIRGPLAKNKIAVYQRPLRIGDKVIMATMLMHSSGEFIDDGELELIFDRTGGRITPMQAMGSAVTYARRYTLQAAAGIAPADDDDGDNAGKPKIEPSGALPQKPATKTPPAANSKPVQKPAGKPATNNFAPAPPELMESVWNLAIERQIPESILKYLVEQGYGFSHPPIWVANEIAKLMENEDCTEATLMAESQRVASRREAARLLKEKEAGVKP